MKRERSEKIREILGKEISQARKSAGLKQVDLAKKAGYSSTVQICRIETGDVLAKDDILERLATAIGLKPNHFIQKRDELIRQQTATSTIGIAPEVATLWGSELGGGTLAEIYHSDATLFDGQALKAEISEKTAEYDSLERDLRIESDSFLQLAVQMRAMPSLKDNPTYWAQMARLHLQIGLASPLVNLVQVLERNGIRIVFTDLLKEETAKTYFDRTRARPVIALNRMHTSERLINNVAMEVALLCLWFCNGNQMLESREANAKSAQAFAAELLLPQASMMDLMRLLNMSKDDWTVDLIREAKIHFGISARMFLHRLDELKLISPGLFASIRERLVKDYGKSEPDPRIPTSTVQSESWLRLLRARTHRSCDAGIPCDTADLRQSQARA